ncbi:MAG: hypothetical protein M0Z66_01425 [Thermaerobacter sp.]|nr:hypothetical protein [Thermaerobacter sp.]
MRARRLLALLLLAPLLAACGAHPTTAPQGNARGQSFAPPPAPRASELVLARKGDLYLVLRPGGPQRRLTKGLKASYPAFSPDGRYVAFLDGASMSGAARIGIVGANGKGLQVFRSAPPVFPGDYAWNPRRDKIAFWGGSLETVRPGGVPQPIAHAAGRVSSFAWAPDGSTYAYAVTPKSSSDVLYIAGSGGAARGLVKAGPANGIDIARFSPSGTNVLYWVDPAHSASLAADGLPLYSAPMGGGTPKLLTTTLPYPSWVQPVGQGVLVVAGDGREATTNKQLARCDAALGGCTQLNTGKGLVALDPAGQAGSGWIAYVAARDVRSDPTPQEVASWNVSRTLYVVYDGKSIGTLQRIAQGDIFDPTWGEGGKELAYVQEGAVWLWRFGEHPVRIAPFGASLDVTSYYGYASYRGNFAWFAPTPAAP